MFKRGSGILAHISSLPSSYGIGDFGQSAYAFVDFLASAKQSYWQLLPLSPTDQACGNSPYSSISAFAGNTIFISPDLLVKDGLLPKDVIALVPEFNASHCEFSRVIEHKTFLLEHAYRVFKEKQIDCAAYDLFCKQEAAWLDDYALFVVIKRIHGGAVWADWDPLLRDRDCDALQGIASQYADEIRQVKYLQYLFAKQWGQLKAYCGKKGIQLIGDIPIYVNYDSVDVWSHRTIFKLNEQHRPRVVAGVPPDYFSETGQLWGNPVYDWDVLQEKNYSWWIDRFTHMLAMYDIIRIDHFRGLVAFWEVPAGEETAINGYWVDVPIDDFLSCVKKEFPNMPLIAEDLGIITDDVRACMKRYKIPGMQILLFAFCEDNPKHPYLPVNYKAHSVVYTGTHDNNTVLGWYVAEATKEDKERLSKFLNKKIKKKELHWDFIAMATESVAQIALIPLQDVFGLGADARMNTPSVGMGNWGWRFDAASLTSEVSDTLAAITTKSNRC